MTISQLSSEQGERTKTTSGSYEKARANKKIAEKALDIAYVNFRKADTALFNTAVALANMEADKSAVKIAVIALSDSNGVFVDRSGKPFPRKEQFELEDRAYRKDLYVKSKTALESAAIGSIVVFQVVPVLDDYIHLFSDLRIGVLKTKTDKTVKIDVSKYDLLTNAFIAMIGGMDFSYGAIGNVKVFNTGDYCSLKIRNLMNSERNAGEELTFSGKLSGQVMGVKDGSLRLRMDDGLVVTIPVERIDKIDITASPKQTK